MDHRVSAVASRARYYAVTSTAPNVETIVGDKKDLREERTLEVFKTLKTVRYCDLPAGVGRKTVTRLIAKRSVEVVDPAIGKYAAKYAWRLVR